MRTLVFAAVLLLTACGPSPDKAAVDAGPVIIETIAKAEMIVLDPHIKEGVFTVFDFYADWCPPCKKLDKSLIDMKKLYGDRMVVYKMDIVDWESAMAKGFGIKDLPFLMVYNPDRTILKAGPSSEALPALIAALNK